MLFRQMFDNVSSTYSYLLASRPGGEALIIDPVLDKVDRYVQLLRELDLRLLKAVDTHLHADHITGLAELRNRTHCITVMGEHTKADVVSMRVEDGDKIQIEGVTLDVLYTPACAIRVDFRTALATSRADARLSGARLEGDTVSTIGEEKACNPRLQVKSVEEYAALMNSLNLPNPKMMDVAVPANTKSFKMLAELAIVSGVDG